MTTKTQLPFGLKRYHIFEPATAWSRIITAKSPQQAIDKAWHQNWEPILNVNGFLHCNKKHLEVREV